MAFTFYNQCSVADAMSAEKKKTVLLSVLSNQKYLVLNLFFYQSVMYM